MTRIFERLSSDNRQHIAKALQRSQLDLLAARDTAHPYFWAAFTLVGEGRLNVSRTMAQQSRLNRPSSE